MSAMNWLRRKLRPLTVSDYTRRLVATGECRLALDIGCGSYSHLSAFRPQIQTVGIDAHPAAIEMARDKKVHDHYFVANILKEDPETILKQTSELGSFDIVSLYGVIEHLPKRLGFELLERCEKLTSKYVILETPHGFVEQGPEFGNEFQRHLSGWFIHDFEGLGYTVYGTTGTRYLRGYMAGRKYSFPGCIFLDELLTLALHINRHPRHAFNLVAIKDVRGVPACYGSDTQHQVERTGQSS
jgi:SAM-dependent methyltransferase